MVNRLQRNQRGISEIEATKSRTTRKMKLLSRLMPRVGSIKEADEKQEESGVPNRGFESSPEFKSQPSKSIITKQHYF